MSLSLAFRFVARRYHATPHGHHVNEGLIEWPPSPWRLLRALISVGYTSGTWNGAGPPPDARRLITKLSADLPCYYLPHAVGTHSRHYMPLGVLDSKKIEKKTLVFDTCARFEDEELVVIWNNADLDQVESSLLALLVEHLNYLGRAESWVEGRMLEKDVLVPAVNCFPEQIEKQPGRGWEQVALLAPLSAPDFAAWRTQALEKALVDLPLPEGKRKPSTTLLRKRNEATTPYPADLLDCLQKDTTWLRSHGWSQPPGSRRVFYWRRTNAIEVGAPKARKKLQAEPVEAMLLSLTNTSRNDHALPSVTKTLPQAELLHKALIGIAAKKGKSPSVLTGRDDNREPLRGTHEHAHINPLDLDEDGHLDHILIWAPMGLDADAQAAIRAVRRTFTKGGIEPLRLALASSGNLTHFVNLPKPYGHRLCQIVAPRGATIWQSLTPFVPPRFIKARGKNTLEGQVRAELRSRGLPEPVSVHQLAPESQLLGGIRLQQSATGDIPKNYDTDWGRLRHFVFARRNGPQPPIRNGFAVRIKFNQPIENHLVSLGYASHFGMGLFHCG